MLVLVFAYSWAILQQTRSSKQVEGKAFQPQRSLSVIILFSIVTDEDIHGRNVLHSTCLLLRVCSRIAQPYLTYAIAMSLYQIICI